MLLIMENKIQIIYIHKYSFLRTFVPCKIAIPIYYRQVLLYSLHWITLIGWGTGWPRKVSRFGADGWLPRHRWLASWESEEKKSHTHLFVFNTNERFRQMDLLLACFSFLFFAFSLSLVRYILFPLKCSKVNIYALRVWIPLCLSQKDISMSLNSTNVRTVN